MSRPARIDIPGVPQHVIVRGNNRTDLFRSTADRKVFLGYLHQAGAYADCELHAFVLMTNHVHLLATGTRRLSISRMMQAVGRRYARYANRAHGRTGTLFEGRFGASLIETGQYLFTCMRYIELNPVRAGLVGHPAEYEWSSYRKNAGMEPFGWIVPRPEYRSLGVDAAERARAYRGLFVRPIADADLIQLRENVKSNRPLGDEAFVQRIERAVAVRLPRARRKTAGSTVKSNLTPSRP